MTEKYDAIVIGTGQSGPALAGRLNADGMKTAVVERKLFGGTCVNVGCTPTKALVASARAAYAWQLVTGRPAIAAETKRVVQLWQTQMDYYAQHQDEARKTATVPLGALPKEMKVPALAAWTVIASVLLNLDETLSKG